MHLIFFALLGLACLPTAYCAPEYCPLLGPVFPAPKNISQDPAFRAATKNISEALSDCINGDTSTKAFLNPDSTSVALQIFSADRPAPLFGSYYTASSARNASLGVNKVDGNTVFRIGSISKLWTMLLLLIEKGDIIFDEPVIKYVPELEDAINDMHNATQELNTVDHVRWGEVTIGELASHLAGISRQYGVGDYALQLKDPEAAGLPKLTKEELPPCGATAACDRADFFNGLLKQRPVVATGATPIYSNAAFRILGYALEKMTNTSYEDLLTRHLIKPLKLTHSSYSAPDAKYGIIPGDAATSSWGVNIGEETPSAGGVYASPNDLSAVGRAILNNTLLPPAITRRWLKPVSHTSSLALAIGSPWEIFSFPNARVVDLYTKAGDIGAYSSMIALSPDHGVGFNILAAGEKTHEVVSYLSDYVATSILPTLDQIAQRAADQRFSGTYVARDTNSTITISTDDGPGLKVTNWTKGDIRIFEALSKFYGDESPADLEVRLYPTGLETDSRISFRAVVQDTGKHLPGIGPFTSSCFTWVTVDGMQYNGVGMDEFVFDVDEKGRAVRVSPRAWQYVLERAYV
ncbi:serine hydrolase domain-containing protein [Aspergillus melleus]|uniref:serine hydrolase domain-containing protein n=1 Tax=Aspergillus melleus TaxID=138277 RepID=UPI001E8EE9BB|nr:uncharacterized protein LDX57_007019 [Aspergillus melleus]KAH8429353.1 hypothetical protein LDX57_007019 [Aspergillus melleus]